MTQLRLTPYCKINSQGTGWGRAVLRLTILDLKIQKMTVMRAKAPVIIAFSLVAGLEQIPYSVLKSLEKFSYRRHVPPSWFLCLLLTLSTSPGDTREENKEHIREVFFVVRDTRSKD